MNAISRDGVRSVSTPPRKDRMEEHGRSDKHKACDACKRRKVRCSGKQPCQNCVRAKEQCQYSSPHGRLANAERRAMRAERRTMLIEAAWTKFMPQMNIEVAIGIVRQELSETTSPSSLAEQAIIDDVADSDHEIEHERANSLEWDESADLTSLADGIGSLSIHSAGIGYMGPQSGNALLRNIQNMSGFPLLSEDEAFRNTDLQMPEETIKSTRFCNQCVDSYFNYYHSAYPILHEGQFRAQLMGALPKPKDGSWPVLYGIVLAIGAHSSEFCRANSDLYYYRQASQHLSWDILRRGSVSLVQALTLMANYLQKRNRPNSGFTMLGIAMNMAQGIGLHREFPGALANVYEMELRRRVWWTLFIFDSGARLTFGRPTLTMGGINISLPRNLDDKDLAVDLEELPDSKEYITLTSCLIWQVRLAKIGNMANERLLAGTPKVDVMLDYGARLKTWRDNLPSYMEHDTLRPDQERFASPRMILLWRSMHLRIVIFRPMILDVIKNRGQLIFGSQSPQHQCIEAASECVMSITSFLVASTIQHGSLIWYACYWLVTAVFVHVTCLLYDPQHISASDWRQHIELARTALESMGYYEPTALRAAHIIRQLLSLVPTTPDDNLFESNETIRMEYAEFWNLPWTDFSLFQTEASPSNASIT